MKNLLNIISKTNKDNSLNYLKSCLELLSNLQNDINIHYLNSYRYIFKYTFFLFFVHFCRFFCIKEIPLDKMLNFFNKDEKFLNNFLLDIFSEKILEVLINLGKTLFAKVDECELVLKVS